jgi:hypothetical protein
MIKRYKFIQLFFITLSAGTISSCVSSNISPSQSNQPVLKIQDYFNGNIKAHGIFLNRKGQVTRFFSIDMKGHWHENHGSLREFIHYNDGKTQLREWQFTLQDANHFTATAGDAVGFARGTQFGNTVQMAYTLNVPVDNSSYALNFNDSIYKIDDGKIINRTTISKFGINLGEIIITYDKK